MEKFVFVWCELEENQDILWGIKSMSRCLSTKDKTVNRSLEIIVVSFLIILSLFFARVTSASDVGVDAIAVYDFDSMNSTTFNLQFIYYDQSLADNVREKAIENWDEYHENIRTYYLKQWDRIDNFDLRFENLEENVFPLVRYLTITGDWWPTNLGGVYGMRFTGGRKGQRDNVKVMFPEGFVSCTIPAPDSRQMQENRETLFYELNDDTTVRIYFTEDGAQLLYTYVFRKIDFSYLLVVFFACLAIIGIGISQMVLALLRRKARSQGKEFPEENMLYLARISAAINGALLLAVVQIELNVWSSFLLVPAALLFFLVLRPERICAAFSKVGASLEPSRPEHLAGILLYVNAFWISAVMLAVLYTDFEFQRVIAFASGTTVLSLLLTMGSFILLSFSAVGFRIPMKRSGFRETIKHKFRAACDRLGLVRPKSFGEDIFLGLLAAGGMATVVWAISGWVPSGIVAEEIMKQATVTSAIVLSVSAGVGEEIFFRGALQPRFGIAPTSLLFGLLHSTYGSVPHVVLAILMGVLLGLLFRHRKNILPPIVAHSVYNLLIFTLFWAR